MQHAFYLVHRQVSYMCQTYCVQVLLPVFAAPLDVSSVHASLLLVVNKASIVMQTPMPVAFRQVCIVAPLNEMKWNVDEGVEH